MLKILTVCTGNICRSPFVASVLATRLSDFGVRVESAGTRARAGTPMTAEAAREAVSAGAANDLVSLHSARLLDETLLDRADLVLAMARDHRRAVVEMSPSVVRRTFTLRELDRLMNDVEETTLRAAAGVGDPAARLARLLIWVSARRGLVVAPSTPQDDDVVDPYQRSQRTYSLSATQMIGSVPAVIRLVRVAYEGADLID